MKNGPKGRRKKAMENFHAIRQDNRKYLDGQKVESSSSVGKKGDRVQFRTMRNEDGPGKARTEKKKEWNDLKGTYDKMQKKNARNRKKASGKTAEYLAKRRKALSGN
jgi:hypothetical protein